MPTPDRDLREHIRRMQCWHRMIGRCRGMVELVDEGADPFNGKGGGSVLGDAAGGLGDVSI